MSYYYNYYIGYRKDGKIYPLGPYNCFKELYSVMSISSNWASDLHDQFYEIADEEISEELRKEFESSLKPDNERYCVKLSVLDYKDLPIGSYIKTGYFLIDDVNDYLSNGNDSEGLFYNKLSPEIYIAKSNNELKFGPPKPKKDCEGFEYTEHAASEYMWFAYPDYNCEEFEAFKLRQVCYMLESYHNHITKENIVILLTQG